MLVSINRKKNAVQALTTDLRPLLENAAMPSSRTNSQSSSRSPTVNDVNRSHTVLDSSAGSTLSSSKKVSSTSSSVSESEGSTSSSPSSPSKC